MTADRPDTIVLIHGFWVTPRSWEHWIDHYERKGFRVLAPAYPGFEVEVEALNADPTPIEEVTVPAIVEHLASVIRPIDPPPVLIGHSAGGVFVQILLDHGYGAVGVAINSAPTGVSPWSRLSGEGELPGAQEPGEPAQGRGFEPRPVALRSTNTFSEEESRALYERYAIPASGRIFWESALATIQPGRQDSWVDFHNDNRAPLLFLSGGEDHLMPPSVQRSNAKHYKSRTVTEVKEYPGPHLGRQPAGRRSRTTRSSGRSSTSGDLSRPDPGLVRDTPPAPRGAVATTGRFLGTRGD